MSIPSNVDTAVLFDTVVSDPLSGYSALTGFYTIKRAGTYLLCGCVCFGEDLSPGSGGGRTAASIFKNGNVFGRPGNQLVPPTQEMQRYFPFASTLGLALNDTVGVGLFQAETLGQAHNSGAGRLDCSFSIEYLHA